MTMKGKKKKKPAICLIITVLAFLIIGAAGFYFINSKKTSPIERPAYEEMYVSTSKFVKLIGTVDHLVYESLYNEGVNEEDISFSEVIPRHENDRDWDFTELSVRTDTRETLKKLSGSIAGKINALSPDVTFKSAAASKKQYVIDINIIGLHTHRVLLACWSKKEPEVSDLPRIAFIIDDIGYDKSIARSFLELDIPVSLSVLPYAPYSRKIAASIVKNNGEMLLHLPMQPKKYPEVDPGKGALMTDMDRDTIQRLVREEIALLPGLKGVNHHMGSLFSEDSIKMKHALDEIKKYDLFYIDSRTSNKTSAYKVAKALGIHTAEKSLFIDNDLSEEALKFQMDRLLGIARTKGQAIGIGHPHRETYNILLKYSELLRKSYNVVYVSNLVE